MDILGALQSFVSAVQSGSLSGAARQRRMSQPAISQQITALESQFDTQLLMRGRSGVKMTPPGEIMYEYAVSLLDQQAKLKSALETTTDKVSGQIVIAADQAFSHSIMGQVIEELANLHPDLNVALHDDDHNLDLAAENIDVALRSGAPGNCQGAIRKIGTQSILHVATPKYLDAAGRPQAPHDLINLDYIQYKSADDQIATPLLRGQETIQAPIKIGLTAQVAYLLFQALYSDLGYVKIPEFLVAEVIKSGQLEVVLPDWKIPEKDLYLVYPSGENRAPQTVALLHTLMKRLDTTKGVELAASAKHLYLKD